MKNMKTVKVAALVAAALASAGLIARKWVARGPGSVPPAATDADQDSE